jgi:hypothetical protein
MPLPQRFTGCSLLVLIILALVALPTSPAFAQRPPLPPLATDAPPPGSPLALGQHPRIFFTAKDVPYLRSRIHQHYRDRFQSFLNLLGNPGALSSDQRKAEANWGSMNFAFVAALGPAELRDLGFVLPSQYQTRTQLCGKAMGYVRSMLPTIASAPLADHNYLTTGYPAPLAVPVAATYDWCHSELSDADRQAIVDAFVAGFARRYGGRNPRTMEVKGLDRLANNQASAGMQDLLSILAFWGEPYAAPGVQQEMYRHFATTWGGRLVAELETLYPDGAGWHEGPGGYFMEGFTNIAWGITAMSSALGRPYPSQLPFFSRQAEFLQGFVKPMTTSSECGPSGTVWCGPKFERWGSMSGGIGAPSCRQAVTAAGIMRHYGIDGAGLMKWSIDNTLGGCDTLGVKFGGAWANAVYYWFLFGDRGIPPISPAESKLPLGLKHGLGLYSFKSSYNDPHATQVVFFAQPYNTYGHGTQNYGDFSLSRFGNLILQAANRKSGDGNLSTTPSAGSLFRNVLTLHRGASDATLSFNASGEVAPLLAAYGLNKIARVGTVLADALNLGEFDYVSYDNSDAFSNKTATLSQREFVYLHGPVDSEYLVLLDRMRAVNPEADEKIWRIWVPNQPKFENGISDHPRPGKWTSSTSTLVSMTNQFGAMESSAFRTPPTSGRFFLRTLLPDRPVINFLGGDKLEFQSGNDDGSTPWGNPKLTQAMREYLGWGRIEVRPSSINHFDLFLNVVQFGNARTLTSPSHMQRIASSSSAMTGVHIRDPRNEWVVLFATDTWPTSPRDKAQYVFPPASAMSRHLLVNMAPSTRFYVKTEATPSGTRVTVDRQPGSPVAIESTAGGVLRFTLNGLAVGTTAPPTSPSGLRLVR